MSAAVTENELFAALRGYASTLEVQFMIEEELKKFQEKTLPKLLSEVSVATNSNHSSGGNSAGPTSALRTNAHTTASLSPSGVLPSSAVLKAADGIGNAAGSVSSTSHHAMPDAEWVQTFLKAHIDDTIARRLPTMIAQEVQRQLRSISGIAASPPPASASQPSLSSLVGQSSNPVLQKDDEKVQQATNNNSSNGDADQHNSSSSSYSEGVTLTSAAGMGMEVRTAMGLPPMPPSHPAAVPTSAEHRRGAASTPSTESCNDVSTQRSSGEKGEERLQDGGNAEGHGSEEPLHTAPLPRAAAADEARRQREMILSAIEDVEHQVNELQRTVDAAVDADVTRVRRWTYLCDVLERKIQAATVRTRPSDADDTNNSAPLQELPLQKRLERFLDDQREESVLATLETIVRSFSSLDSASGSRQPPRSPSQLYQNASPSSPILDTMRREHNSNGTGTDALRFEARQQLSASPNASPARPIDPSVREPSQSSDPPSPPPTAPFTASAGPASAGASAHVSSTPTATAATRQPFFNSGSPQQQQLSQQQQQQHASSHAINSRGVRSILTKGANTAVSSPVSVALSGSERSPRANGLDGTAVRRPAPSLQDCVDAPTAVPGRSPDTVAARGPPSASHVSSLPSSATVAEVLRPVPRGPEMTTADTAPTSLYPSSHRSSRVAGVPPRAITLGIDAVNVPAGVLPDALGRHGAVRVQSVTHRQLAEKAGLCKGDILLSVDRRSVHSCEQLRDVLLAVPPAQTALTVEVYRHTAHQIITVLLKL